MKLLLVNNFNGSGGMKTHGIAMKEILDTISSCTVDILNEDNPYSYNKEIETYDHVIRYSRFQGENQDFQNAQFGRNISTNTQKNILVLFADATKFAKSKINEINILYDNIRADSIYSAKQAGIAGIKKVSCVVQPSFEERFLMDKREKSIHERETKSNEKYSFLHISSRHMQKIKGVDLILKAFFEEFSKSDNTILNLVVGTTTKDNDYIEYYKDLFRREGRGEQLNVIEEKYPYEQLFDLYIKNDCYVNASRTETFSCPTIEAAAMGLNIIMPNTTGMAEYSQYIQFKNITTTQTTMPAGIRKNNNTTLRYEPEIKTLKENMRYYFIKRELTNKLTINKILEQYSIQVIGSRVKDTLIKLNT